MTRLSGRQSKYGRDGKQAVLFCAGGHFREWLAAERAERGLTAQSGSENVSPMLTLALYMKENV